MSLIWNLWRNFWFAPLSPLPLAVFRIFFGLLTIQTVAVHEWPTLIFWYGPHGVIPISYVRQYFWSNSPAFDLLLLLPATDSSVYIFFGALLLISFFLTIGFLTRYSAILVCLCVVSAQHHQPFNLNGGDNFLKLASIFLAFSHCGAVLSVDRLMQRVRFYPLPEPLCNPWAQRMIQVQLAIAYWQTFCCKIVGPQWLDGTAVYYATRLDDLLKFNPKFLLNNLFFCKLLSWYTLFVEFGMWALVWLPEFRYFFLVSVALLHFGIDSILNLPVFEWMFIATLTLFIEPKDLYWCGEKLQLAIAKIFGAPTPLIYKASFIREAHLADIVKSLDLFGRLALTVAEPDLDESSPGIQDIPDLKIDTNYGALSGYSALLWLSLRLPLLWLLAPLFFILLPIGPNILRGLSACWTNFVSESSVNNSSHSPAVLPTT